MNLVGMCLNFLRSFLGFIGFDYVIIKFIYFGEFFNLNGEVKSFNIVNCF